MLLAALLMLHLLRVATGRCVDFTTDNFAPTYPPISEIPSTAQERIRAAHAGVERFLRIQTARGPLYHIDYVNVTGGYAMQVQYDSVTLLECPGRGTEGAFGCDYTPFSNGIMGHESSRRAVHGVLREMQNAERYGVRFVAMHGSLIGQTFNAEVLPWDRDLDFSILAADVPHLHRYLSTLHVRHGSKLQTEHNKGTAGFTFYERGDLEWYLDTNTNHHIEYRLMAPCSVPPYMIYVDITVLYDDAWHAARQYKTISAPLSQPGGLGRVLVMKANTRALWGGHIYDPDDVLPMHRCVLHRVSVWCPRDKDRVLRQEYRNYMSSRYKQYVFRSPCWYGP